MTKVAILTDGIIAGVLRRMSIAAMAAIVLAIGMMAASISRAYAADDVVNITIEKPFNEVVTAMKREIAAHQLVIVKEVPFQQMLGMVGVKADPVLGLEIFHPRYGKILYEKNRSALKEAPLRIVVFGSGQKTTVEYRKPSAVFASYSGLGGVGKELDDAFADIVERVAQ